MSEVQRNHPSLKKSDQRHGSSVRASSTGEVDFVVSAMQLCVQSSSSRSNTFCAHVLSVVQNFLHFYSSLFLSFPLCVGVCTHMYNLISLSSLLALLRLVSEWYYKPF